MKILKEWKPLKVYRFQRNAATILSGNPKINWTKEKIEYAFDQPIPEGEITSVVCITLLKDPRRGIILSEFWFINSLGIIEFYKHDKKSNTFIRAPHHTQKVA
jgi:hypothetical protein